MFKASTMASVIAASFIASTAFAGVSGTVKTSKKSSTKKLNMKSDPQCKKIAKDKISNDIVVNGGGLADTMVYIANPPKKDKNGKKFKAPKKAVKLDQIGCRYIPKVFGVMVKQKIEIINSDPMLHNIHPTGKNSFNLAMPTQGMKLKKKFKKASVFTPIKCDVHPWMQAYAGVFKHPFFAVTDKNGKFNIDGVPDGSYDIVAKHPKLGEKKGKLTVAGGNGSADFSF